jgi:S-adenosylmethionine/arginine decarboxylase-like enzyme
MNHFTCWEESHVKSKVDWITYKLHDCDAQRLSSPAIVWRLLREVTGDSWKTRLDDSVSGLPGGEISGFVRWHGMHITIHTWPLKRYAELSVAFCNSQFVTERIDLFFANRLGAAWVQGIDASLSSASDELVLQA